jgi:RecA-family ATPase
MPDDFKAGAVKSAALANAETFPARNAGPPLIHAPDLMARPMTPRPWFVPDVSPGALVTEVRADGGGGKSTLLLQASACAVTGRAWLDMPVSRGPAIYLASEDDEDELRRRLDAIAVHLGVTNADLTGLHLWPLAADDPALVVTKAGAAERTSRFDELASHVEAIRPVVVVLDSRADVFAAEELNRKQVRDFIAELRRLALATRAAVVILAHPSLSGQANRTGNSGSTHWTNAVRSVLYLRQPDQDSGVSPDPDARLLEVLKSNYARAGLPLPLRWSAGAFVVDQARPRATNRGEAEAAAERVFLELLDAYRASGRDVHYTTGNGYAPKVFSADERAAGFDKHALAGAMNRLFARGALTVESYGPPSRPYKRLARAAQ